MNEEQIRAIIRQELSFLIKNNKLVFDRPMQILDGNDIVLASEHGTRIGTATTQKLAFLGATPLAKQVGVLRDVSLDPTGTAGWDVYARAGVQSLNSAIMNLGLASY